MMVLRALHSDATVTLRCCRNSFLFFAADRQVADFLQSGPSKGGE